MKRLLLAAVALGVVTVASGAQAASPLYRGSAQFAGWNHHHRHVDHCYQPQFRYYRPPVVYYPRVVPAPVVVSPYYYPRNYVSYYPGNYASIAGRNFSLQFGW